MVQNVEEKFTEKFPCVGKSNFIRENTKADFPRCPGINAHENTLVE